MITYCIAGNEPCLSAEAWAGWAQAFGAVVAILGTAWAVQRAHRLQIHAEQARELRGVAQEFEMYEALFGEASVLLKVAMASEIEQAAYDAPIPERQRTLMEIQEAIDLIHGSGTVRPLVAIPFIRGRNAALAARRTMSTRIGGAAPELNAQFEATFTHHMKVLDEVVAELRGLREKHST